MRRFPAICAATFLLSGMALAADPTGEWLVANGEAHIRIDDCDGILWGIISWERDPGGIDDHNPDPAKRNLPLLGSHVLLAMHPSQPNRWDGEVYNGENGKTYTAHMSLASPDVLRIEGCVFAILCGGENWTRMKSPEPPAAVRPARPSPPQARAGRPNAPPPPPAPPVLNACSGVTDGSGAAHQGGLK
jgi:uncharacterized protein (DUF2147 family)